MPATTEFVSDLFAGGRGAHRYLSELLAPGEGSYVLQPHVVAAGSTPVDVFRSGDLALSAVRVMHAAVPALAWRVEIGARTVVFSGDTNGEGEGLTRLAANADLFIAHNAVPEGAAVLERHLHMPPSVIGRIAAGARVRSLVLSHRMLRTLGQEAATASEVRKRYSGPQTFANDLDCFALE
jgi:ribonuclease BN (tRNA processing enzyme)